MSDIVLSGFGDVSPARMSSKEIASLCEKDHKNVIRDIRTMLDALADGSDLSHVEERKDSRGYTLEFLLPRDLTMTLVSGYNVQLRHRIVTRLAEIEQRQSADPLAVLNDATAMRGILLSYTEKVIALESRVAEMEPEVAAYERLAVSDGSLCFRDAAKVLQVRPKDLTDFLVSHHWVYTRIGVPGYIAYQPKLQAGLLEHKTTTVHRSDGSEKVVSQCRITPKGLARLAKEFPPIAQAA